MKLEELLEAELYAQVQAKIDEKNANEPDKLKHIRYADLSEGEYVSKSKYADLESEKSSVAEQLKTAQGLIEELKNSTSKDEGLQTKISEYETAVAELKEENIRLKTESALKVALLDAGAKPSDMDYLLYKAGQSGEIKLDDTGKIKGQAELVEGLKTSCPSQFLADQQKLIQENKLPDGNNNNPANEPKTLAEALKLQYETETKSSNLN